VSAYLAVRHSSKNVWSELDTPFRERTEFYRQPLGSLSASAICCPSGPTRRHGHPSDSRARICSPTADPSDQASFFFARLDQASGLRPRRPTARDEHPQRAKKLPEAMPTWSRLGRGSSGIALAKLHVYLPTPCPAVALPESWSQF